MLHYMNICTQFSAVSPLCPSVISNILDFSFYTTTSIFLLLFLSVLLPFHVGFFPFLSFSTPFSACLASLLPPSPKLPVLSSPIERWIIRQRGRCSWNTFKYLSGFNFLSNASYELPPWQQLRHHKTLVFNERINAAPIRCSPLYVCVYLCVRVYEREVFWYLCDRQQADKLSRYKQRKKRQFLLSVFKPVRCEMLLIGEYKAAWGAIKSVLIAWHQLTFNLLTPLLLVSFRAHHFLNVIFLCHAPNFTF